MKRYLIIGQGTIGLPVAVALAKRGFEVAGCARTPKSYPDMEGAPTFVQKNANELTAEDVAGFSHVLIIITPDAQEDRVKAYQDSYLKVCQHIAKIYHDDPTLLASLTRLYFLSSTSVYGENHGEIVDEHTKAMPVADTAKILVQAEDALFKVFLDKVTMIRASGIYGVARQRLIKLAHRTEYPDSMMAQYSNRIMDVDLVTVVANIMSDDKWDKQIYIATDTKPVLMGEVLAFIKHYLQLDKMQTYTITQPTGKRLVANIDTNWLSFQDYRQGYAHVLRAYQGEDIDKIQ